MSRAIVSGLVIAGAAAGCRVIRDELAGRRRITAAPPVTEPADPVPPRLPQPWSPVAAGVRDPADDPCGAPPLRRTGGAR